MCLSKSQDDTCNSGCQNARLPTSAVVFGIGVSIQPSKGTRFVTNGTTVLFA